MHDKSAAMDLTTKIMFAVFIVVFASLVILIVFSAREETLTEEKINENILSVNRFLISLSSKPECFAFGGYAVGDRQVPILGLVSSQKIYEKKEKGDLDCINNFDFLYHVTFTDLKTGNYATFGVEQPPPETELEVSFSIPIEIFYNSITLPQKTNPGTAKLTAYFGPPIYFYNAIKEVCFSKTSRVVFFKTDSISSYSGKNFCVNDFCFNPSFDCSIGAFRIGPGEHILFLKYSDMKIEVQK